MRRAFSGTLRGETRPLKRICPPPTRSPHSDLSYPPLSVRCAERVHHHSASLFFGLAVGGCIGPSPSTIHPFAASGLRDRRHTQLSPTAYVPHVGQFSVKCFTLHHPKQGCRGLSFVVEDVTSPRPSRHPKSDMSSSAPHSASSIAFLSRMEASTRGIALGSPHSSVWLHTSVWVESPRFDGVQLTVVNSA